MRQKQQAWDGSPKPRPRSKAAAVTFSHHGAKLSRATTDFGSTQKKAAADGGAPTSVLKKNSRPPSQRQQRLDKAYKQYCNNAELKH